MGHPQIATFARLAKGSAAPNRVIAGQATKLSRTMHDIRYDPVNDEILVTNPFANAVLVFRGAAEGEEAPIRIIQGPKTLIGDADRLDVDPVHDEIFVPNVDLVLVFPRTASGNVAPIRVIRGQNTQLRRAAAIAVDPVNNLIVIGQNGREGLTIFNRTDNGNVKPRGVIRGPKSGIVRITQMAVNPVRRLVIATQPGITSEMEPEGAFIGVWSLDDNGDVPPRWKINAGPQTTLKKPRGVALIPKHKEIVVADMRLNAVLTFYFPEIF
ncbi:MAG: hypothetical protein O7A06_16195 [Acidobacteria bacterium]|nr:hypothetical protein [Acidobacteriota bacterium]MCZ6751269.1 hypothetical protein [Acidobacteriota bacterium]